jgi:hypothetical protein
MREREIHKMEGKTLILAVAPLNTTIHQIHLKLKPDPSYPQLQTPKPQPGHFKVGLAHHHEQGCGGSHGE